MSSNPYEPTTAMRNPTGSDTAQLNWRSILISVAICFGVGIAVGIGWGIIALTLAYTFGPAVKTLIDSPILVVAGFAAGLIPSIVGAVYLGKTIESRWLTHAIIYSTANTLIQCLFMLIPSESGTSWTDLGYCILLIPVSVVCVFITSK